MISLLDSSMLLAVIDGQAGPEAFFHQDLAVSEITKLSILGDTNLSLERLRLLEELFRHIRVLPITDQVMAAALQIRQQSRLSLHDALIGGTAIAHRLVLSTNRPEVFAQANLPCHNPLDANQRIIDELLRKEAENQ